MSPSPHSASVTTDVILGLFDSLMRHVAGWHAPEFLGLDVTMSQAKCLYLVALRPGMGMSALAERLGVGLSAVSGLVDRLVEHGYVERHEDLADRRQLQLSLTTSGEAVVEHIRELNTGHLRALLAGLSATELDAVRTALVAMDREARRLDPPGNTFPSSSPEGKTS